MNIDSKILRYVEGKLEGKIKKDFEDLIGGVRFQIFQRFFNNIGSLHLRK